MEYSEIDRFRGDSRWFQRGNHFFVAFRSRPGTIYLRCCSPHCPVRWTLKGESAGPLSRVHDHPEMPWVPNRNTMFQSLKRRAASETIALSAIYEQEAARFPDAAPHLLWENVISSMRTWRRAQQPSVPSTLSGYAASLAEHSRHSNMLVATVSAGDAAAVILAADGFGSIIRDSSVIVADGTFLTVPAGLPAMQILTIHAIIEGQFFHPVLVLMENRRRPLYEAVLSRLWSAAGNPTPQHIITDFEPALQIALQNVSGVQVQGCLFHFVQALLRRARSEGIRVGRNTPGGQLVQLYGTLALLPAAQVALGLAEVPAIAEERALPFNPAFHEYFQSYWMARVGPETFSTYGRVHQTSNVAESYHATLRRSLGPSPNIWRFTDIISEKFAVTVSRREAQRLGNLPRRNRERQYFRSQVQDRNTRALERGTITLREFLVATSRLLDVVGGVVLDDADIPVVGAEVEVAPEAQPVLPEVLPRPPSPPLVEPRLRCGICLDSEPSLALIPCGHVTCVDCHRNLLNPICPFCRTEIDRVQQLFM